MDYRKSKNFWLKLVGVSVSYSVLVSFAIVLWQPHVVPLLLTEDSGPIWLAISSCTGWLILPAIVALFLLGRLYGLNFFKELLHSRDWPTDMAARGFAAFAAAASGLPLMFVVVLPVIGGEPYGVILAINAIAGSAIGAMLLASCIVLAERARAGEAPGDADEAGA